MTAHFGVSSQSINSCTLAKTFLSHFFLNFAVNIQDYKPILSNWNCCNESGKQLTIKHVKFPDSWIVNLTCQSSCKVRHRIKITFKPANSSVATGSWECRTTSTGAGKWKMAYNVEENGHLISEISLCVPESYNITCKKTCANLYSKSKLEILTYVYAQKTYI